MEKDREIVEKALEYLLALTGNIGPTSQLLKTVAIKFERAYKVGREELRVRYVDAISAFIEETDGGNRGITKPVISTLLVKSHGNYMALWLLLALGGVLSLGNNDQVS